jgi:hypothetical protein
VHVAQPFCDESGVGFAAHLEENSTPLWSHHMVRRSDETWLPEGSGNLGGVQRWRSSFGLRRQASYPERFAQQALGHNSRAVHHAYSKHAEVTVPSLDDWEKEWGKNSQRNVQPKLLPVDFRSTLLAISQTN